MKLTTLFLFSLSLLCAFVSQISLTIAGEIPGYIGQQSFRLDEDQRLFELGRRADEAKRDLVKIDEVKVQMSEQVRIHTESRDAILNRMNTLQGKIEGSKSTKVSQLAKLEELKKAPDTNKEQIDLIQAQLLELEKMILETSKLAGATKLDLANQNIRLDQALHSLEIVAQNSGNAQSRLQSIARERELYRQGLIGALLVINAEGANRGQVDGANDGAGLAGRLGQDLGSRDGEADGYTQGTIEGQNRSYRRGADKGQRDGAERARSLGLRDGTQEGIDKGNTSAGVREGMTAGNKRGDESNAAVVGVELGKKAGLSRAETTGSVDGNNKGESETVQKFESGDLKSVIINGAFIGSFSRRSPEYPGDFNGPSFNPRTFNNRELMKRAYTDGYTAKYRQMTRYEYLRQIDSYYNSAYDNRFASTFDTLANREFADYYDRGRIEADARAFGHDYPIAKAAALRIAFEETNEKPIRSSEQYVQSFKSSELEAFNTRYAQIKNAHFDRTELETFQNNIGAQTEKYRQKRIGEVSTVYTKNAVLSFVDSEMLDAGINGIAKGDGIYQPSEATLHSVTLRNFGMMPAQEVSLQLDNGSVIKLPEIPARSLVTIKGAGLSKIADSAAIGSTARISLKVLSKLTSNDVVEAAHFDSIGGGILKNADKKAVRVDYPLTLSGLALNSQLLQGVSNKLSLTVSNQSKRPYKGDLKVDVSVNSESLILKKLFSTLASVESSAQLSDAEVLVTDEADLYRTLNFSASISQNGVTLGVLSSDMQTMAKAAYSDKVKRPVLVANSDKDLIQLKDALDVLGGVKNASVLDLSLASQNANVLANGLNQKVLLIVDDRKGSNINSLNPLMTKSKSSTFVFIDEYASGLENALNLAATKDAQKLRWGKKLVAFTNPHRALGVEKSSALIQSSLRSFSKDLTLASDLTMSANDLIARFKSTVNRESFFTPNDAIKMYSLKAMAEVMCLNKAYDESGGIFTRNKKWAQIISDDETLFINVLKAASKGSVNEEKLSVVLPAIAMKDTLSNAMNDEDRISHDIKREIQKTTNKVLSNMEEGFNKSLKSFNRDLYNKVYEKVSIHRPFPIDSSDSDN